MPIAVIPARYAAQRFPGKPLARIAGKPMVQHVFERCGEARCFSRVIVATDDARIVEVVKAFGGEAVLTSPACASGTDRVAEVARGLKLAPEAVVVNVQGDEPAVHPESLMLLARAFDSDAVQMGTLVRPLNDDERPNPNVVKVVRDEAGNALYFSRTDIPFQRDAGTTGIKRWAHLGLYGYRAHVLETLSTLQPTFLEKAESLEQLRALGNGIAIACVETRHSTQAVDTPGDVPLAEAALLKLPKPYPP
jgi:3-deoxy-manno-octulosonate cytidylyltransferase (CMP-KDO synthetase)